MVRYEDGLTLAAARERYFLENGFNPAYDDRWVKLRLGRRSLPLFPNTRARVAAARIHDLHHVAAEYETTWVGEGEISAWELAGSCGPYLAAWVLNLSAFGVGLCLAPRRMWRAFMRGRNSHNLYGEGVSATRLAQSLGEVRRELGLDRALGAPAPADIAFFCLWVLLALLYAFGGMLSFALFALALWKMPPSERARLPASTENEAAPAE
jgi:hypothetical protein